MKGALAILRRTWLAPSLGPVTFVGSGLAWLATRVLAPTVLGGGEDFVAQVREGSLLFAGLLVLSLAEPMDVGADARAGVLALRAARGWGFALASRCLALVVAALPPLCLAAWASGGLPVAAWRLLVQLVVVGSAGLLLGAWLERRLMVPALWCLVVASYLAPWLAEGAPSLAWVLPRLADLNGPVEVLQALLWACGALLLANRRLVGLVERGG